MSGTVYFLPAQEELEISDEPRVFCPTTAIDRDDEGNRFVWVADHEKRARKIAIRTGDDREGRTEILEGLTGNERVIVNPEKMQEGLAD